MKRILVPLDFSACSMHAFEFACQMVLKNNAKLLLVHALEYPMSPTIDPTGASVFQSYDADTIDIQKKKARTRMEDLLRRLDVPDDKVSYHIEMGRPSQLVIESIKSHGIDLVVMGSHGASGIRELMIGSNAQRIVRLAKCPVLTLKSDVQLDDIKHIAFGSDFKDLDDKTMAQLKQLQDMFGATIDFVRVNTPNNFQRDKVTNRLISDMMKREMFMRATANVYNDMTEEEGLISYAEENGCDMIGMITHGRTGLDRLASGSIAEGVVNHTELPLWTIRVLG